MNPYMDRLCRLIFPPDSLFTTASPIFFTIFEDGTEVTFISHVYGQSPHDLSQPVLILLIAEYNINAFPSQAQDLLPRQVEMRLNETPFVRYRAPEDTHIISLRFVRQSHFLFFQIQP